MFEYIFLVLLIVVVGISIAILIVLLRNGGPTRLPIPETGASGGHDTLHISAYNSNQDALMYDGTFYVLRLRDVRLSSTSTPLKYSSVISDGYVSFDTSQQNKYALGKNGIKVVYHDNSTLFLVVPVSYTHEWLNKGLISISDNQYVLDRNLFVVGSVELKEAVVPRIPLPLPEKSSIAMVF
jgi:hypothetical protein